MTIAELLASDEGKAAIAEAAKAATAAEVSGLKAKNDQLLGEKKAEQTKREELQAEHDKVKAETEALKLKKAKEGDDPEEAIKLINEKHENELRIRDEKDAEKNTKIDNATKDSALEKAISSAKIADEYRPAVKALIEAEHSLEIAESSDGKSVVRIEGQNIDEFLKTWSQSDTGKLYIAAPNNGGGGSGGSGRPSGAGSTDDVMKLSPQERIRQGRKRKAS